MEERLPRIDKQPQAGHGCAATCRQPSARKDRRRRCGGRQKPAAGARDHWISALHEALKNHSSMGRSAGRSKRFAPAGRAPLGHEPPLAARETGLMEPTAMANAIKAEWNGQKEVAPHMGEAQPKVAGRPVA